MPRRTRKDLLGGSLVVSGPFEEERSVPEIGVGLSVAQGWACKHRDESEDEITYYVRDFLGVTLATITKDEDGAVLTNVL